MKLKLSQPHNGILHTHYATIFQYCTGIGIGTKRRRPCETCKTAAENTL